MAEGIFPDVLKTGKITPSLYIRKVTLKKLRTTVLSPHCLSSVKSSKSSFTQEYTDSLALKELYRTHSLDLGNPTLHLMQ